MKMKLFGVSLKMRKSDGVGVNLCLKQSKRMFNFLVLVYGDVKVFYLQVCIKEKMVLVGS